VERVLILTGFMGAGKSSVARRVAARLGWEAVDLDAVIEARAGRTIAEIFEKDGEEYFRNLETEALRDILGRDGVVLATGGGTLLRESNRQLLEGRWVVNLSASFDTLLARIRKSGAVRPLVRGGEGRLKMLFEARHPLYEAIERQVSTEGKTSYNVAEEVLAMFREPGPRIGSKG
jgi:shikimate kinase